MTNDADWVQDVKRWYLSSQASASLAESAHGDDDTALGYEAAHPALQARHWPDAVALTTDR